MGRTLYGYADKLWKIDKSFSCMNQPQEFTLDPGEYLFICKGAAGGGTNATNHWGYGGASYGVFQTDRTETLYAMVGGNGEAYDGSTNPHAGGWNGGGNGGTTTTGNTSGSGGGGASDIRLTLDDTEVPPVYTNNLPEEYQEVAFLQLKNADQGYINTGYLPRANSKYVMDAWFPRFASIKRNSWMIPFGSRSQSGNSDEFYFGIRGRSGDMRIIAGIYTDFKYPSNDDVMMYNKDVQITFDTNYVTWTDGTETKRMDFSYSLVDSSYPVYLMALNSGNSPSSYCFGMRLYRFKIYESDVLVHDFVPCYRISDNKSGVYDKVTNAFIASSGTVQAREKETTTRSLLSRIIVAGGGGGNCRNSSSRGGHTLCYGGGQLGGYIRSPNIGSNDNTVGCCADQSTQPSDPDCKFGKGMDAPTRTSSPSNGVDGGGGGGGGWYGGYAASAVTATESSTPGSGGSGYVLTADSYKPYGYIPDSHYYLQHPATVPCQSDTGQILVCKESKILKEGDTIIVPLSGMATKIPFSPGTYDLKCWGGEGGLWMDSSTRYHGGYSTGRLILSDQKNVYAVVGGSGLWCDIMPYVDRQGIYNEFCGYNGGGSVDRLQTLYANSLMPMAGGGATDIRLTMDETPVHPPIPDPDIRDDIPAGYTQLKYLQGTNRSDYFEPGYIIKTNTSIHFDYLIWERSGNYPFVWGSDSPSNTYCNALGVHTNGGVWWSVDSGTTYVSDPLMDMNVRIQADMTPTSLRWTDGTKNAYFTTPGIVNCRNTVIFGGLHRSSTYQDYLGLRFYNLKIWEDDVLLHDYQPVVRNSDNVAGFLDIVTNEFKVYNHIRGELRPTTFESKTLLSRIIVAGGSGGHGYSSGIPGKGGGTTGGTPQNGNGTNAGPGTQTESPQNASYPGINGGFGYGGKGYLTNGGRAGAGGGGWFGGSGTYPNGSNDDDKGGSGGSGYVLTADSYKPEYYIPTEEWYLTNASTTLGGNTLPPNVTKIEIDVIESFPIKYILHDSEGYKEYNSNTDRWEVFYDGISITPEMIEEHGSFTIPNINGTQNDFDIIYNDPESIIEGCEVEYLPLPQTIEFLVPNHYHASDANIDIVYDPTIYDYSTFVSKYDNQYTSYKLTIDKKTNSDEILKLYSIMLISR